MLSQKLRQSHFPPRHITFETPSESWAELIYYEYGPCNIIYDIHTLSLSLSLNDVVFVLLGVKPAINPVPSSHPSLHPLGEGGRKRQGGKKKYQVEKYFRCRHRLASVDSHPSHFLTALNQGININTRPIHPLPDVSESEYIHWGESLSECDGSAV